MLNFTTDIKFLKGVGEKKAALLKKELNISTVGDLIYYFPYKYIDRTRFYKINQIFSDLPYIQLKGKIVEFRTEGDKFNQRLIASFTDGTGFIDLVWFKGAKWILQNLRIGADYIVFGKPNIFRNIVNLPHPEIDLVQEFDETLNSTLESAYSTTEKLKNGFITSKAIFKLQQTVFKTIGIQIQETLPEYLLLKLNLLPLHEALMYVHFPKNEEILQQARYRLKFEELFYIQLNLLKIKTSRFQKSNGFVFSKVGEFLNTFYQNYLPFDLTDAQKRVIREIRKDMGSGKQMNRLLQGDVGSGKTIVSLMCMLIALDNGFQACMMAPTEILAHQHFETISIYLKDMPIKVRLLTGSTKVKMRRIIHEELLNGELQILIGTHTLIEDTVQFKNLGLAVIDEQHRFGVAQRASLWQKNVQPPHVIVMTATPIPRTLAMTLYGDLDVSVIDELPPGRKNIKTLHSFDSGRLRVFGFIKKQIAAGRQIYIVYPLIKESEKMDYKDLEDGYESISRAFPPPEYLVSIVHGKMKSAEKERSMQLFISGQAQILVATTVIEVGVNVPNASMMVIESAERFGLSQLHQLRGRVGRGADQSYCLLMTSFKISKEGRQRIRTMLKTNDGFEIAEEDMRLRGPGDIEGTQQSGIPFDLKIANLAKDGVILQKARNQAEEILEADPKLEKSDNQVLIQQLKKISKEKPIWGVIS